MASPFGANTAIFSVANAVLFRERSADPNRCVDIYQNDPAARPLVVIPYDVYQAMAEYTHIFARKTMAAGIPLSARYLHEGGIRRRTAEYGTKWPVPVNGELHAVTEA